MTQRVSDAPESDAVVAMLSVTLERGMGEPLVRQLYLRLRELILTRRLMPGVRLPSTRKLSRDLQVSRTVTLDAFGQLAAEGFLESRAGAGHFVAPLVLSDPEVAQHAVGAATDEPGPSIWNPAGRPFDPAWPAVDLFPSQVWSRMLGRGWRRHQSSALERHWGGLPELRDALAKHLRALRGIALTPEQVMITAGHADVLSLIARAACSSRRGWPSAWVENPGLGTSRQILERNGVSPVPIAVDAEGLQVAEGERLAPDAALALVTPTRQFPLGMPLSLPRRLALLDWSRRSGAIIVDDDYDSEIRFTGRPLQSLASLDPGARVLTLGSFSKLTFPGLRLGYAVGPADLIAQLAECRRDSYALVPTSTQAAFAEFVATGAFARHLRGLRNNLSRRRMMLVEALRSEAGDLLEILPQEVGMHLAVRLAPALACQVSDVALAERARAEGIVLLPLSQQYAGGERGSGFFLGYAGWPAEELRAPIERFAKLLRDSIAR